MGFPISELIERTGVGATTIHYYVRLGLLHPPRRTSSNRFEYDDVHVRSLKLIRALRERGKPSLAVINVALPELLALPDDRAFDQTAWDEILAKHEWRARALRARPSSSVPP